MFNKGINIEELDKVAGGSVRSDLKEFERLVKKQLKERADFENRRSMMESLAQQRIQAAEKDIKEAMLAALH